MITIDKIRLIRNAAKTLGFDINEITVSPSCYLDLKSEYERMRLFQAISLDDNLYMYDIKINKRKCIGCCSHDTL